jgi:ubiquinone biosynthesis protein UbiJ
LALREAVDRLEQRVGQDALKALWYSRIRDRVWRWAYGEWTERGEQSGWAMSMVFDWMADLAEVLGDLPATAINRENARIARPAA